MRYLDYNRLKASSDTQLSTFLITVNQTDHMRRCRVAFPEYFQDTLSLLQIDWSDIVTRYQAVSGAAWRDDWEEQVNDTFSWFGIEVEKFEFREDGVEQKGYKLLPNHLILERDGEYNGMMSDENQWLIKYSKKVPDRQSNEDEYLVLKVLITGKDNPKFFLWAVKTSFIDFNY